MSRTNQKISLIFHVFGVSKTSSVPTRFECLQSVLCVQDVQHILYVQGAQMVFNFLTSKLRVNIDHTARIRSPLPLCVLCSEDR